MKQAEPSGGLWALLKDMVAGWFGPIERSRHRG